MATPTGNENTRSTISGLEDIKKKQGDYNNLLKESIQLLKQADKQYDSIEARISSMSESSINVKEIEKEIEKVRTRHFINAKKLQEIEKDISEDANRNATSYMNLQNEIAEHEKEAARARKLGNIAEAELREKIISDATIQLEIASESLTLEESQLIALREATRLDGESLKFAEEKLKKEKEIRKAVGFTGAAMTFFADKIGVAASYQEALVQKAKDLQKVGKQLTFGDKIAALGKASMGALTEVIKDPLAFAAAWKAVSAGFDKLGGAFAKAGSAAASMSEHSTTGVRTLTSGISDLAKNIPMVGGLIGGLIDGFAGLLDFAVGATAHIHEMGRQIGLSAQESINLNNQFSDFATHSGKATLNSEELFKTHLAISKQLGINNQLSMENLETAHELQKFAGLEESSVAQLGAVSTITGKSIHDIGAGVAGQLQGLKKATGIALPFQKTMQDLTSLSGVLGLQFAKYPAKITSAYVTTKALGLELNKVNSMADGFLDFESSISKEFEAQLLTGKNVNFQKVRELALNNDLAGVAAEITKQVGNSNDFLSMNRIQQESFAQAAGMSRDELADMLKQQEMLSKFGAKDTKDLQDKVKLLQEQGRSQEAINKLGSEEAFNKYLTASASENLSGFIDKIKQSFADLVSNTGLANFVEKIIKFMSQPENIMRIVNKVKDAFATIVDIMGSIMGGIMRFLNKFPGIDIDEDMIDMVEGAGDKIRSANLGSLAGGTSVGEKAAASTVAATTPAKAQGFAKPENMTGNQNATIVNNNIYLDDSTTTKQTYRHVTLDKSKNH